ncbi:uncharacterized protein BCR38DRAFT_431008 [Pseudomassariella vexata]|uniref:CCHC-type domain-containing protein n=1 Tax=Pseudomassariella vexata TaxID=1141098 RepID=A0A1Y2DZS7_9PEZI|nr:uncharacterized protein BCR38DRAFT_431008 [Pseudomassariella vexata]ORY64788.1 hypothetical protein BCR38DRAFT_431008 [Pseudomassariella vexata]
MARHYPLDGLNLDFGRYEHRDLGPQDMMVNRIMENYMFPGKVKGRVLRQKIDSNFTFGPIKTQDRELGLDMQVMWRMLATEWDMTLHHVPGMCNLLLHGDITTRWTKISSKNYWVKKFWNGRFVWKDKRPYHWPLLENMVLGLVQRHYLEVEPSSRLYGAHARKLCQHGAGPPEAPGWKNEMIEHLKSYRVSAKRQWTHSLFSGTSWYPPCDNPAEWWFISIDPIFFSLPLKDLKARLREIRPKSYRKRQKSTKIGELHDIECLTRGRPQRTASMPPPGSWATASFLGDDPGEEMGYWIIYFPRRRISELDKMARRRSLSRSHIRAMFRDKLPRRSDQYGNLSNNKSGGPCANCAQRTHRTLTCPYQCGHCDKEGHQAPACPVKASNRCKCRPFPELHVVAECKIRCSRRCGNSYPPGHHKHLNAMTCTYRCCMCGLQGHSGKECRCKTCRCGGRHLGQGCRWKVECRVEGCDRYLCGLHCSECGTKRNKSSNFVGGRCQDCLGNGHPVAPTADRNRDL